MRAPPLLDIGLHVGKNFVESFPERVYTSSLIPSLNEAKRLGEKSGKGFYKVRMLRGSARGTHLLCPCARSSWHHTVLSAVCAVGQSAA
jgi:3-hydroxyacyl-CoA dehydrogenase